MDGATLERIAKSDPAVAKAYVGVYSMDGDWTEPTKLPACYVINTDTRQGTGEHWVTFYLDDDGSSDYFDPYGTAPIKKIYKWLKKKTPTIRYNTKWIQGPLSGICWAYVLYFLHMRCRHVPLETILASFRNYDFTRNDTLALSLFQALA